MRSAGQAASACCLVSLAIVATACASEASALDPAGPRAARIAQLTWVMTGLGVLVFVGVLAVLFLALWRSRDGRAFVQAPPETRLIVAGGILLPALVIPLLWVLTLRDIAATADPPSEPIVTIEVTGRQWYYEVRYPEHGVVLINEMRLPAGGPVRLRIRADDVIHSFWAPRLAGKIDMIPGRVNDYWIQADEVGDYEVRCAEFCGLWHARMRMRITAETAADFERWVRTARAP